MPTTWYEGRVVNIIDTTASVKQFFLKVEGVDSFDFLPGQFVTVDLPISEKRLGRWRSYSIANAPDGSNVIELCVGRLEGGSGTDFLFNEVEIDSKLRFKGPDGMFVLPKDLNKELVLICTGTGVAPFRSMIAHVVNNKLDHNGIHLIFGTRTQDDLLYKEEFLKWQEVDDRFTFDVTLSQDQASESWQHEGYVHSVYLEHYKDVKPDRTFMICGWSEMIDETVANLILKLGYDKNQLKFELYG